MWRLAPTFLTDDRVARFAAAEAALIKALSLAPKHARAHWLLGIVQIFTNRAAQGIAECEQALALDRNLANAHGSHRSAPSIFSVAARKPRPISKRHSASLLAIRTPIIWMMFAGFAKLQLGADAEAVAWLRRARRGQPKLSRRAFLSRRRAGAARSSWMRRGPRRRRGLRSTRLSPSAAIRANAPSDNPTYLAGRERIYEGMRMAGVPEG